MEEAPDIEIGDAILKETNKCEKDFSCLSHKKRDICKAEGILSNGLVKIECNEFNACNYKTFASSVFCGCPTRKEIFKKYKM